VLRGRRRREGREEKRLRLRGDCLNEGRDDSPAETGAARSAARTIVISTVGVTQILAWGSSYYLLAVLAKPIAADTGWSLAWIFGSMSLGLMVAGLVSPKVGRTIAARGGRPVLAVSSALLAIGLGLLSIANGLPLFIAAWLVMGLGMGAGLYDAAFATLGKLYGSDARSAITALTLWGGFASTVCWPLSAILTDYAGWRGACLIYALIQLLLALPLHLLLLPRGELRTEVGRDHVKASEPPKVLSGRDATLAFVLLAVITTLGGLTGSLLSVHLLTILQERGRELAVAVALGTLIGPAQVGGRLVEMAFGRHYHPLWTLLSAYSLVAVGVGLLAIDALSLVLALIFYGAGSGIGSIARGSVPLALFGPRDYAVIVGRIARPSFVAQAIAPSIGGVLLGIGGASLTLDTLALIALVNVALAVAVWWMFRPT
jgi:predicted MFS family arabinose efflux permease